MRLACLALLSIAASVNAQGILPTHKRSAALANELVGESVRECAQKGYKVVAVVVNHEGGRRAVLRGAGAPVHSLDNAYYKAYTIASMGPARNEESTKQIADRLAKAPTSPRPGLPLPKPTYATCGAH